MYIIFATLSMLFLIGSTLDDGDDCILEDSGQNGRCVSVYQCEEAKEILQSKRRPQQCGFNRHTILVCCPIRNGNLQVFPKGTLSEKMCRSYHHIFNQRDGVANGEKAKPQEFPHMAAVGYSDGNKILWLCGGSLISEQFVLTAAHCANSEEYGSPKIIRLGDLILDDDDVYSENMPVEEIFIHPFYKTTSVYHDIALIKIQQVVFGIYIKPACLYVTKTVPSNNLQATGWGKTDFFGDSSTHLMKVNLTIISYEQCTKRYSFETFRLEEGIIDEIQICAGDSSGRDTCPGDSGGPLQFERWCENCDVLSHFAVVAVTSFGKGCGVGETVGVYTRVSAYVDWIEKIVWG